MVIIPSILTITHLFLQVDICFVFRINLKSLSYVCLLCFVLLCVAFIHCFNVFVSQSFSLVCVITILIVQCHIIVLWNYEKVQLPYLFYVRLFSTCDDWQRQTLCLSFCLIDECGRETQPFTQQQY